MRSGRSARRSYAGLLCLAVLLSPTAALAQGPVELEFGGRVGVPFTVPLQSNLTGAGSIFSSESFNRPPYSIGPTFSVLIHDRVAVEFDALYKPIKFHDSFTG